MARLLALASLATAACSDAGTHSTWSEADSAGVRIVTSRSEPPVRWTLGEPTVRLGTIDGGPTEFFQIRDMLLHPTGEIVVGNAGSDELRVFGSDGAHLRTLAGRGRGPGELYGLSMVRTLGDSLVTYDGRNDRISVFGPEGGFTRSFRLEWTAGLLGPADIVPGVGILSVQTTHMVDLERSGLNVDTAVVRHHDMQGGVVKELLRLPHNERVVRFSGDLQTTLGAPFSSFASFVGMKSGFCYAFGTAVQIRCFDWSGRTTHIMRIDEAPRAVEQQDIDDYVERFLASPRGARPTLRASLAEMPYPEHMPSFDRLLLAADGLIWARRYRPSTEVAETWTVFGAAGHVVARVSAPERMDVMFVGAEEVLARHRDEFDVEYVVRTPIIKAVR